MADPPPGDMQKYPSMTSVYTTGSMASFATLAPGHGYIPRKQKPEKPFGLPYLTIMNRTHRGPGRKFMNYALIIGALSLLFFAGGALYFGHRNVSRMLVFRTEALGAMMIMIGIVLVSFMGRYCARARYESNRWRAGIKFRAEGLNTAAPVNVDYVPEMEEFGKLQTGTYGPRALKMIPKSKDYYKKKKKKRARAASKQDLLDEVEEGNVTPRQGLYQKNQGNVPAYDNASQFGTLGGPPPGYDGHTPEGAYMEADLENSPQFSYGPPSGDLRRQTSQEKMLLAGASHLPVSESDL